jgi:hypothetical protein
MTEEWLSYITGEPGEHGASRSVASRSSPQSP